jgi:hypothetical protein
MIHPEDLVVRYENMPTSVQSLIRENPDMSFTIIMNSRCSRKANIDAYWHELGHLEHDDLNRDDPTDQIEAEAHRGK